MDESVERLTVEYLWKIANLVSESCPPASRHYVLTMVRRLLNDDQVADFGAERQTLFCNHCGSIWKPGNHRVRIKPCPVASKNIRKLFRCKRDQPWNLTKQQKKQISSFEKSTNKIVYECFICKKRTVFKGDKKAKIPEVDLPNIPLPTISFAPKDKPPVVVSEENCRSATPEECVSFIFSDPYNSPPQTVQARDAIFAPAFTFSSPNANDTPVTSTSVNLSFEKEKLEKVTEEKKKDELYSGSVNDFLKTLRDKSTGKENSAKEENKSTFNTYKADKELLEPVDTGFGDKFRPKTGSLECTSCLVRNEPEVDKCVSCETSKPGSVDNQKSKPLCFGDKFKPAAGSWECTTCLVRNRANDQTCVSCEAEKPHATKSTSENSVQGSDVPAVEKSESVRTKNDKMTKTPAETWECDACSEKNPVHQLKCVACETSKISSETASVGAKPLSNSSFGGFSQNQPVTTAAVSNFTFGMPASNAAPVSGGFSVPNSNPGIFAFGAKTTQAASSGVNNTGALANPNPVFGNPVSQSVFSNMSAIPSFGKHLEQKQETQSGFSFGSSSSQPPVFRFGGTQDGPQEKRHATAPPPAGGFNFNLPQASAVSFNPTAPPTFNLGGTTPASTPLFEFNASADPSSGQSSGVRKIRKAVRRGVRKPD